MYSNGIAMNSFSCITCWLWPAAGRLRYDVTTVLLLLLLLIITQDAHQASLTQYSPVITSPALYSSSADTIKLDLTELRKLGFRYRN